MKMKRNSNLELRLLPPALYFPDPDLKEGSSSSSSGTPQYQKMTIFYNGRICVSDVTQLQARAIIMLANRAMEEKSSRRNPHGSGLPNNSTRFHHHHRHQDLSPPLHSPNVGASMKRSLQRFLQKRKDRIQSTSPYH